MYKNSKLLGFFYYMLLLLIIDFILTSAVIKKTNYWSNINNKFFSSKDWRIKSNLFHHDLKKNISVIESWGGHSYKLITNSLGFRDSSNKKIDLKSIDKKRIYINGDSFVEGVGLNYNDTAVGLLEKSYSKKYKVLNSAVASYSPSIYYTKTKYFINKGLEFDYCLIFLDISDIPDENFISEDDYGNIYDLRERKKEHSFKGKIYKISRLYVNNFTTGKVIAVLRELIGSKKSQIKKKILSSKYYKKSYFSISKDELNIFKSTNIDRSMWTYDEKYSKKWKTKGLEKSSFYLEKLFKLLESREIKSYLVIYPNPGQILNNIENIHEKYWLNWSEKNNVNIINLYKYFNTVNKVETVQKYFIPGDVHWNKDGNILVFNALKKELASSIK